MKKSKTLFCGPFPPPNTGDGIKNSILKNSLNRSINTTIEYIDTICRDKNRIKLYISIIYEIIKHQQIILSLNKNGRYALTPITVFLSFFTSKKISLFIMGGAFHEQIGELHPIKRRLFLFFLKRLHYIFVESTTMKQGLEKLSLKNIKIIFNPRDDSGHRWKLNNSNRNKILFASRITPTKGVDYLINSVIELNKKGRNLSVDFYGPIDNQYSSTFFNTINKYPFFWYGGIANPEDVQGLFPHYHAFALPTYHSGEGLPGILVEAGFAGIPVIISNFNSISEYVKDNVSVAMIIPQNQDNLTEKIDLVITNNSYAQQISEGIQDAVTTFHSNHVIQQVLLALRAKKLGDLEPMINAINNRKLELFWLPFHLILGGISIYTPWVLIGWFYLLVGWGIVKVIINNSKSQPHLLIAYIFGIEILCRLSDTSPHIPWEMGKYLPIPLILTILIFEKGTKSNIWLGLWIVMLALPAIIITHVPLDRIVISAFGLVNLGILTMFFYQRKLSIIQVVDTLRVILFPLISILVFITIETPKFEEISFGLGANFETTAGMPSNQMSTILGIGMMILGICFLINQKIFQWQWLNLFFLGFFFFRGLITFSRGGMIVPILALFIFYLMIKNSKELYKYGITTRKIKWTKILAAAIIIVSVFYLSDYITKGLLTKRYMGETNYTLQHGGTTSMNELTTGRWNIILSDIQMFKENPLLGVGAGNSPVLREKYGYHNILTHTEFSRIISEHGALGLIILLLILVYPFLNYKRPRIEKSVFFSFWLVSIGTSMHAAMRTMATPFFFGFSLIKITEVENKQ